MDQGDNITEKQYPFSKIEDYVHFSGNTLENAYILDENWVFEDANLAFNDREARLSTIYNGIEFLTFTGAGQSNKDIILRGTISFFSKERGFIPACWMDDLPDAEKHLIIPEKHYLRKPFRKILPTLKQMYDRSLWISLSPEWVEITRGEEIDTALMQFYLRFLKRQQTVILEDQEQK